MTHTKRMVQVRGEFAGTDGGWRPGITGTLNQSEFSDEDASTVTNDGDAVELCEMIQAAGASPNDIRVIAIGESK